MRRAVELLKSYKAAGPGRILAEAFQADLLTLVDTCQDPEERKRR